MKICFIGAGSLGFTRNLLTDIMSVPELRGAEIAFMDINAHNLEMVTALCQRDLEANGIQTKIQATLDRREAFRDANYVINCVRIGVLEGFTTDVEIPLKYGVDQCVGDTLCIGGIMYGQRVVAAMLDFCKDMREVSAPDVLHLNYSNPNAMATWACNEYGKVPTIGLCHGEMHGEYQIAEALGHKRSELDFICAGINHQTWYISVKKDGVELTPQLLAAYERHPVLSKQEKVRIDIMRRFGYFSTESNGHLSEYLAWYRKREDELADWIDLSVWIHGETGGYLRDCSGRRDWFIQDYPNAMAAPPKVYDGSQRGEEHGSYIIEALQTRRMYRGHFNVVNGGCIANLAPDCIVEVPCYADGNGISVPAVGPLPDGPAAICQQSVNVQRLAVKAAIEGNVWLLKQAALLDPLTGAVCTPREIDQMVDEMLIAQEQWLPQYAGALPQIKKNWAKAEQEGRLIPPKQYTGVRNCE
ncbi:MAG: alpha-glucosidase/alpha-galactosidase [Defluviitaleaceae bacterium]|nr:alpha-glucosidase/alpha-galactosidase [Defluviitaleaceae bacterium]MCL2240746.1 alpha-glucosidase/alpha-galactosidase [Defluviitaleaceae bacterium]